MLLCIDTKSGFMSRYERNGGKPKRTHKPFQFNAPLGGGADWLMAIDIVRTDPDSQSLEREPVHVG